MRQLILGLATIALLTGCEKDQGNDPKGSKDEPEPPQHPKQGVQLSWKGEQIGDRYFKEAAMLVPFYSANDSFYFQVDLGAEQSVVYQGALGLVDTTFNTGSSKPMIHFNVNDSAFDNSFSIAEEPSKSSELTSINGNKVAGILGYDFFGSLHFTLDYNNDRLYFGNPPASTALPEEFEPITSRVRNNKIQFKLNGSPLWLIFDTGSSLFDIITNQDQWQNLTSSTITDTLRIPADKTNGATSQILHGSRIVKDIGIGGINLNNHRAHYMRERSIPFNRLSPGSSGIIGNNPFIDRAIINLNPRLNQFKIALQLSGKRH